MVQGGLKSWVSSLGNVQRYRNLAYGIGQFPISILAFVLAIVIPATTLALLLSPVAEIVSSRIFSFNLFEQDLIMKWLFPIGRAFNAPGLTPDSA